MPGPPPLGDGQPWWVGAFDADYLDRYAHRDDHQAAREVAGVLPRLRAAADRGPVLDACCGAGRHLAALRRAGLRVWGFDYSRALLGAAAQRPEAHGRLVRGDMRAPPFAAGWAAITLFFTAFGYFDDDTNASTLAALADRLMPGGWLMLDLPDPDHLRRTLVAESRRQLNDGSAVVERRRMDGSRVVKRSHISHPDGRRRTVEERVRLYHDDELQALAEQGGLGVAEIWPSLAGPEVPGDRRVVWMRR